MKQPLKLRIIGLPMLNLHEQNEPNHNRNVNNRVVKAVSDYIEHVPFATGVNSRKFAGSIPYGAIGIFH